MRKQITFARAPPGSQGGFIRPGCKSAFFLSCFILGIQRNGAQYAALCDITPGGLPVGLSMPYPLPGTALYERVKKQINRAWRPEESLFGSHVFIYRSDFSEAKMWFGIFKGHFQLALSHRMGKLGALILPLFEKSTDLLFRVFK